MRDLVALTEVCQRRLKVVYCRSDFAAERQLRPSAAKVDTSANCILLGSRHVLLAPRFIQRPKTVSAQVKLTTMSLDKSRLIMPETPRFQKHVLQVAWAHIGSQLHMQRPLEQVEAADELRRLSRDHNDRH